MLHRFAISDLQRPVIAAPMAGGPSTPELAAAVGKAGGLGVLAGGLLTAEAMADQLTATRKLSAGPVAVNVFVPQPVPQNSAEIDAYARTLSAEEARYGVSLGSPSYSDGDWSAKLDVIGDLKPDLVSFTFGLPETDELARIQKAGITTMAGVASSSDAIAACDRGIDSIVVQGPKAGGHRFTLDPLAPAPMQPLEDLLVAVRATCDVPVVAAGGLAGWADVERMHRLGAAAAQLGTAFLLADEAGTPPVHRAALTNCAFTETAVTRAFTGRYARCLRNRFVNQHDTHAVTGFPNVAYLTGPVLAAAAKAGDPQGTALWAGTEFRRAASAPAADIVASLV
jgi:nitronate monooxygenase